MTTGAWLASLARRITHPDTFERMVSPALADLQREAVGGGGWRTHLAHYAGLMAVLFAALLRDWRVAASLAFDSNARRDVWLVTALWFLAPTVLLAGLILRQQTPWHLLNVSAWPAVVFEAALAARLYASYVAAVAAGVFLGRRLSPARALGISVGVITLTFVTLNIVATLTRAPLNRMLHETASRNLAAVEAPAADGASWESQQWPRWVEWHGEQATRDATAAELGRAVAGAPYGAVFNFLPFALLGVALARASGWSVAVHFAAVIATAIAVFLMLEGALGPARMRSGVYAEGNNFFEHFEQMGSLVVAGLIWRFVVPAASRAVMHSYKPVSQLPESRET